MADAPTKSGGRLEQVEQPASYLESKTLINTAWRKAWEAEDPTYSHSIDHMHRLPRKHQRAIFRLSTGHVPFKTHLFKVAKSSSSVCSCRFAEQTVKYMDPTRLPKPWGHKTKHMAYTEFLTGETEGLTNQPCPDQQLPEILNWLGTQKKKKREESRRKPFFSRWLSWLHPRNIV